MNYQLIPAISDLNVTQSFFDPRWYVLFVRTNQEKRVAQGLAERDVEHLLPCYSSVRQWKDRKVRLEIPMFPGYVFVRLPLIERMRALTVPQVIAMVGKKESPSVVSPEEIEWVRTGAAEGLAEPDDYIAVGQRVVVIDGVMRGMQGTLVRKGNSARVVVALNSIARAFAVEVEASAVRAIAN